MGPPVEKQHARHGQPCANPECRKPLVTGCIRGRTCTRAGCKVWATSAGVTKKYKPRRNTHPVPQENVDPQVVETAGAHCRSEAPEKAAAPPQKEVPDLLDVVRILSVHEHLTQQQIAANLAFIASGSDERENGTLQVFVEGSFRRGGGAVVPGYEWVAAEQVSRSLGVEPQDLLSGSCVLGERLDRLMPEERLVSAAACPRAASAASASSTVPASAAAAAATAASTPMSQAAVKNVLKPAVLLLFGRSKGAGTPVKVSELLSAVDLPLDQVLEPLCELGIFRDTGDKEYFLDWRV